MREERVHRMSSDRAAHYGIAIGSGVRDGLGPRNARDTRFVLDNNSVAQFFGQMLGNQTPRVLSGSHRVPLCDATGNDHVARRYLTLYLLLQ